MKKKLLLNFSAIVSVTYSVFAQTYVGFGSITPGGQGKTVYHVTSLADSGPGTLRDAVAQYNGTNRYVVFDTSGIITLSSDIVIRGHHLTIDGATANAPGITIRESGGTTYKGGLTIAGTHDIIITHLRFLGNYTQGAPNVNNVLLNIDGDSGPDYIAKNIVLDHITVRNAVDGGPDIWGEVQNVTISNCFFFYSWHPTTVSHYPSPFQIRKGITMYHNVYAKNDERNPQLRADVQDLDYSNNVIYDWGYYSKLTGGVGGYGIRIKNNTGEPKVNANLRNNFFIPKSTRPDWCLVYGLDPGPDTEDGGPTTLMTQDSVYTGSKMGSLYVRGNYFDPANKDHYSTIANPLQIAAYAQVNIYPLCKLSKIIKDSAGVKHRDITEQTIINELVSKMDSLIAPCPQATRAGEIDSNEIVKIYPNPVEEHFRIEIKSNTVSDMFIKITDMNGREIYNEHKFYFSGNHEVYLKEQSTGIYFIKLITGTKVLVKKIALK